MSDCIFCRIVTRQTPADIEYEDDAVLAFKDLYPKAPVHLLIIPKRHIDSIAHLEGADAEVIGRCFTAARALVRRRGSPERYVITSTGRGGQWIPSISISPPTGAGKRGLDLRLAASPALAQLPRHPFMIRTSRIRSLQACAHGP